MKPIYEPKGKAKEYGDFYKIFTQAVLIIVFTVLHQMFCIKTEKHFIRK